MSVFIVERTDRLTQNVKSLALNKVQNILLLL